MALTVAFTVETDPRYGQFGLRTECPRCGAHLPVNGPAEEVDCAGCGQRVSVPAGVLRSMLDAFEDGWPDAAHADSLTVGDLTWRWTSDPAEGATCPACSAPLDDSGADELLRCSSCAAQVPSLAPPDSLSDVRGFARVIGGEVDQTRDAVHVAPVVLACPSCGSGLTITNAHQRITPCDRCGSQVHLPDAVWRQLHPPRTVRPWTVRFQGQSRPARARDLAAAAAERAAKKKAEELEQKLRRSQQEQEQRREREEREREEAAKAAAEAERLRLEREEADRARRRWILPLNALSAVGTITALALMAAATAMFALAHTHAFYRFGPTGIFTARMVSDALVVLGALVTAVVWLLGVVAAGLRAGKPLGGVFFWSCFMAGLSIIPVIGPFLGLFWAWQHFVGAEPTPDTDKLPRGTGWPLAPLYAVGPLYAHLCYAAAGDMTLGQFFRFLFD